MDLITVVVGWGVNPVSGDVGAGVCGEGFMRDITAVFTELDACYASRPLARDPKRRQYCARTGISAGIAFSVTSRLGSNMAHLLRPRNVFQGMVGATVSFRV